jgi:heme/copper-type cytochrome/quinol oxidase subunit 2
MTFVSFVYIILIISPGLLLFLDYDFISSFTNFNVYVLGYQWAWNYNVLFNNLSYSFDQLVNTSSSFSLLSGMFDYQLGSLDYISCQSLTLFYRSISYFLMISSIDSLSNSTFSWFIKWSVKLSAESLNCVCSYAYCSLSSYLLLFLRVIDVFTTHSIYWVSQSNIFNNFYLCLFSNYLVLSLYSIISLYVYSFDVIHSFGYHSFGFKSDCIPGRVNLVSSLSLHFNGYFISYCYELCGSSHTSMLSSIVVL